MTNKDILREKISKETLAFLKKGGRIIQLPDGPGPKIETIIFVAPKILSSLTGGHVTSKTERYDAEWRLSDDWINTEYGLVS